MQKYTPHRSPGHHRTHTHPSHTPINVLIMWEESLQMYTDAFKHQLAQLYSAFCCSIPPSCIYLSISSTPQQTGFQSEFCLSFLPATCFSSPSKSERSSTFNPVTSLQQSVCLPATDRYPHFYDATRLKCPCQTFSWHN